MEKRGTSKEQEMAPAIFTEEIVEQFSNLCRNQKKVGRVQVMVTTGRGEEDFKFERTKGRNQKNIQ